MLICCLFKYKERVELKGENKRRKRFDCVLSVYMIKVYNEQTATKPKPHGELRVYIPVDVAMLCGSNRQWRVGFTYSKAQAAVIWFRANREQRKPKCAVS